MPLVLFVLTCLSTFYVSAFEYSKELEAMVFAPLQGLIYSGALMTILLSHELGHYLQARRHGVPATLPFFLPMPASFVGTMGAVIAMDSRVKDRKALFDIGVTGPLAGLVPTIVFCAVGLYLSKPERLTGHEMYLGDPLLFKLLNHWIHGPLPEGSDIMVSKLALAGWVGLLITAINLFPIGQLDGGHILYALLRRRAHFVATALLVGAIAAVVVAVRWFGQWGMVGWTVMLGLLTLMGPRHPPTADDDVPLGVGRTLLGWGTLAFLILGFTPNPLPNP